MGRKRNTLAALSEYAQESLFVESVNDAISHAQEVSAAAELALVSRSRMRAPTRHVVTDDEAALALVGLCGSPPASPPPADATPAPIVATAAPRMPTPKVPTVTARDIPRLIALLEISARSAVDARTKGGKSWAYDIPEFVFRTMNELAEIGTTAVHAMRDAGGIAAVEKIVKRLAAPNMALNSLPLLNAALKVLLHLESHGAPVQAPQVASVVGECERPGTPPCVFHTPSEPAQPSAAVAANLWGGPAAAAAMPPAVRQDSVGRQYAAIPALLGLGGAQPAPSAAAMPPMVPLPMFASMPPLDSAALGCAAPISAVPPGTRDAHAGSSRPLSPSNGSKPPTAPTSPRPISPQSQQMAENRARVDQIHLLAARQLGVNTMGAQLFKLLTPQGVDSPTSKRRRLSKLSLT
uniref:Uncharacterized protein n=1 Tax=Prymnesium polylepis TaxID=72548 RepID=A0A7S4IL69_9EUKA|mmetsp:Transcript_32832/g.81726  ORF Transcript_32832/g.81726 Transcript_32832/m.81726 type:complete len:409 (+) Transcript_32832:53-1279(+)